MSKTMTQNVKQLNFATEQEFKIQKTSNGFYVQTREPSDQEENTEVLRSHVFEEPENFGDGFDKESEEAELRNFIKLIWSMKEFFGILGNHVIMDIKLTEKETGKEIEYE